MFPAQLVAHVPYAVVASFVRIVLVVVYKINDAKNDVVMDMPLVNVRRQNILILPLCYSIGKLPPDFMSGLVIDFPRLKGLYEVVGEIVSLIQRLRQVKFKLNICRFSRAAKRGHKHFFICLGGILNIVKGFD